MPEPITARLVGTDLAPEQAGTQPPRTCAVRCAAQFRGGVTVRAYSVGVRP